MKIKLFLYKHIEGYIWNSFSKLSHRSRHYVKKHAMMSYVTHCMSAPIYKQWASTRTSKCKQRIAMIWYKLPSLFALNKYICENLPVLETCYVDVPKFVLLHQQAFDSPMSNIESSSIYYQSVSCHYFDMHFFFICVMMYSICNYLTFLIKKFVYN